MEEEQGNAVQLGIDVSKWNGEIDWEVVKAEGVDFAIIRCGYRGSSCLSILCEPNVWRSHLRNIEIIVIPVSWCGCWDRRKSGFEY